ncbi:MAG: molybdopterin-dependent oxidoreductase [Thermomicrobiales bacterium]|nr:molybdopterin-dependent oxidoreductase [Thermomicrobiales bacterium]
MAAGPSPTDAPVTARSAWLANAARAGVVAALAMLFAQLLWRLLGNSGAPSFPETIVAAISRLTPLGVFGWATESFGGLAKDALFVVALLGMLAVGRAAGAWAGRMALADRPGGRWPAGFAIAALLLLAALVVIMPLAHFGIFATDSRYGGAIVLQTAITFALWALVWGWVAGPIPARRPNPVAVTGGPMVTRRGAMQSAAVGLGALVLTGGVGALAWRLIRSTGGGNTAARIDVAGEATARAIEATAAARAAGQPIAGAATPEAIPAPSFAQLQADGLLTPRLTATADFYHVSKNIADPVVSADGWVLTIDGLVEQPLTFTLDQLQQRATTQNITTLGCISNELNGDLISTAEWTGIPLAELLREARVKPEAIDLVFTCADDYQDSVPVALGLDPKTLLVVGMNGAPLPPDHGFPLRAIVPPIYGMKNTKWLQHIELVNEDFKGYWETRGWSDAANYQIWGRIDTPRIGDGTPAGPAVAAGLAFAGDRGVRQVEVSLDEGATWTDAELETPLNAPFTWVRWRFPFIATDSGPLWIRITDGAGTVAPQQENPPLPDGATGWPHRNIHVV